MLPRARTPSPPPPRSPASASPTSAAAALPAVSPADQRWSSSDGGASIAYSDIDPASPPPASPPLSISSDDDAPPIQQPRHVAPAPLRLPVAYSVDLLNDKLAAMGLRKVTEEGDGNCLFRALATQLYGDAGYYRAMRAILCDHIEGNPVFFANHVDPGTTVAAHVSRMRAWGVWGTDAEMVAAENVFNRPVVTIRIDQYTDATPLLRLLVMPALLPHILQQQPSPIATINLLYSPGHFNSLLNTNHHASPYPLLAAPHQLPTGEFVSIAAHRGCIVIPHRDPRQLQLPQPPPPQPPPSPPPSPPPPCPSNSAARKQHHHAVKRARPVNHTAPSHSGPSKHQRPPAAHRVKKHMMTTRASSLSSAQPPPSAPTAAVCGLAPAHQKRTALIHIIYTLVSWKLLTRRVTAALGPNDHEMTGWDLQPSLAGNGTTCAVLTTLPEYQPTAITVLSKAFPTWSIVDPAMVVPDAPTWSPNSTTRCLATINVHSMIRKRADVTELIERHNIAVTAIQETRRTTASDPSRQIVAPGCTLFEVLAAEGRSKVGVALLIDRSLSPQRLPFDSDFIVAAVVQHLLPAPAPTHTIAVSVYIPCVGAPRRKDALADIIKVAQLLDSPELRSHAMILMGDWNTTAADLAVWAAEHAPLLALLAPESHMPTRCTSDGAVHRDIDHILISANLLHHLPRIHPTVDTTWTSSDHRPVIVQLPLLSQSAAQPDTPSPVTVPRRFRPLRHWPKDNPPKPPPGQDPSAQQPPPRLEDTLAWRFCTHPVFCALVTPDGIWARPIATLEDLEKATTDLLEACWTVGYDTGIAIRPRTSTTDTPPAAGKSRMVWHGLSPSVRAELRKKQDIAVALRSASADQRQVLQHKHQQARANVNSAMKQQQHEATIDLLAKGITAAARGSKSAWDTLKQLTALVAGADPTAPRTVNPVCGADGSLLTAPTDIKAAWLQHFTNIFRPDTLFPPGYFAARVGDPSPPHRDLPDGFTFALCMRALQDMKPGRAPGPDGILPDVFRLTLNVETPIACAPHSLREAQPTAIPINSPRVWDPPITDCAYFSLAPALLPHIPPPHRAPSPDGRESWADTRDNLYKHRAEVYASPRPPPATIQLPHDDMQVDTSAARRQPPQATPRSPFGAAMWRILQGMHSLGYIPTDLRTADLIPLIKKASDQTVMDNYRGISLIPALARVLGTACKLLLEDILEADKTIIPEQAGFRVHEEAVAQATAVYEVCARRRDDGKVTALLFIDFVKAFDRVSHQAIFAHLGRLGFTGKWLGLVEALYNTTAVQVRFADNTRSPPIPLATGVRQGCPLSPSVFKVFINSIIAACSVFIPGVHVVGLPYRAIGGLFADDTVLFTDSSLDLCHAIQAVSTWCDENGMQLNPTKSAVVIMGAGPVRKAAWLEELQAPDLLAARTVRGTPIPITTSYTYLGIELGEELDLDVAADARVKKTHGVLAHLQTTLRNNQIPLVMRGDVIKAVIIPSLLYGAELWGTDPTRLKRAQQLIDAALRATLNLGHNTRLTAVATIAEELNVPTAAAIVAAKVIRLHRSAGSKNTWIGILSRFAPADTSKTSLSWFTAASRMCPPVDPSQSAHPLSTTSTSAAITKGVWAARTLTVAQSRVTLNRYITKAFRNTSPAQSRYLYPPQWGRGLTLLARLRCDALGLSKIMSRVLFSQLRTFCWVCWDENREETPEHFLLRCPLWHTQRHRYLKSLIQTAKRMLFNANEAACDESVFALIIGGATKSGLRMDHWFAAATAHSPQSVYARHLPTTNWDAQPPHLCVAAFLQTVWAVRTPLIFSLRGLIEPAAEVKFTESPALELSSTPASISPASPAPSQSQQAPAAPPPSRPLPRRTIDAYFARVASCPAPPSPQLPPPSSPPPPTPPSFPSCRPLPPPSPSH